MPQCHRTVMCKLEDALAKRARLRSYAVGSRGDSQVVCRRGASVVRSGLLSERQHGACCSEVDAPFTYLKRGSFSHDRLRFSPQILTH